MFNNNIIKSLKQKIVSSYILGGLYSTVITGKNEDILINRLKE